jgi:hypothetical protein
VNFLIGLLEFQLPVKWFGRGVSGRPYHTHKLRPAGRVGSARAHIRSHSHIETYTCAVFSLTQAETPGVLTIHFAESIIPVINTTFSHSDIYYHYRLSLPHLDYFPQSRVPLTPDSSTTMTTLLAPCSPPQAMSPETWHCFFQCGLSLVDPTSSVIKLHVLCCMQKQYPQIASIFPADQLLLLLSEPKAQLATPRVKRKLNADTDSLPPASRRTSTTPTMLQVHAEVSDSRYSVPSAVDRIAPFRVKIMREFVDLAKSCPIEGYRMRPELLMSLLLVDPATENGEAVAEILVREMDKYQMSLINM